MLKVNTLAEELQLSLEKAGEGETAGDVGGSADDWDDEKPMIAKEGGKGKSLLGSLMGLSLVNIKETDDETVV